MTIIELQNILNELKIPKDLYSIMICGLPNEALCITNDENGRYIIVREDVNRD